MRLTIKDTPLRLYVALLRTTTDKQTSELVIVEIVKRIAEIKYRGTKINKLIEHYRSNYV